MKIFHSDVWTNFGRSAPECLLSTVRTRPTVQILSPKLSKKPPQCHLSCLLATILSTDLRKDRSTLRALKFDRRTDRAEKPNVTQPTVMQSIFNQNQVPNVIKVLKRRKRGFLNNLFAYSQVNFIDKIK